MNRKWTAPCLMTFLMAIFLSLEGAIPQSEEEARIRTLREESNQAIERHDLNGIIRFLDSEFQITTGNGRLLQGRHEMREAFSAQFSQFEDAVYLRTIDRIELSTSLAIAFEQGTWEGSWTTLQGKLRTGGTYAGYWRKVGGNGRSVRNSSLRFIARDRPAPEAAQTFPRGNAFR